MIFSTQDDKERNQKIEIQLLLEVIFLKYGYDFRKYSKAHVNRRILFELGRSRLSSIAEMQHKILYDPEFFHVLLLDLSLNVTEMFRDPEFFVTLREKIVPLLQNFPVIKIWHAGCSTGEEVYSMAIMLKEENLLDRCIIYGTDFNQIVLDTAAKAIYPIDKIKDYSKNYNLAKGKASLSDYFTVKYGAAKLNNELKKNIVFSDHNLVSDGMFGEMHMIVCRNVLIYFNRELQNKVHRLFLSSLVSGGILCLGPKESLLLSDCKDAYTTLHNSIYKKKHSHTFEKTMN
jgi:chemotaxis protein methyltransferase CheR